MAEIKKTPGGLEFVLNVPGLRSAADVEVHVSSDTRGVDSLEVRLPGMDAPAAMEIPKDFDSETCRVKLRKGVGTLTVSFAYKKQHGESSSEKPPSSRDAGLVLLESPCDLVATLENKMIYAVMDGKASEVSDLLLAGASPMAWDGSGSPALCLAAASGRQDIVALLLQAGADIEGRTREEGNAGQTALHTACWNGEAGVVRQLLLEGADPGARDEDMETPLMVAARLGSLEICRDLVAAGAQAADRDSNDWLAAEKAASRGHAKVVEFLGGLHPGPGAEAPG